MTHKYLYMQYPIKKNKWDNKLMLTAIKECHDTKMGNKIEESHNQKHEIQKLLL